MISVLHLLCEVSLNKSDFFLKGLREIVSTVVGLFTTDQPHRATSIGRSLSVTVPTVIQRMDLEPVHQTFVCCPKCYCCHSPTNSSSIPARCTFRLTSQSKICGARLSRKPKQNAHTTRRPQRRYLYQDMKQWMASLLCRPGMEAFLDREVLVDNPLPVSKDIWDGEALRSLKGVDGRPFLCRTDATEGRYVFSLNMDGLNPRGNKQAGKKTSIGAIYMVCLNLPPEIRYDIENMFLVGIIPGPHEPSLSQINHLLRPLVADLLEFWDRGIWYSSTPTHLRGRLVRCALGPLVCDLPAGRKMAGYSSHSATLFCSFCALPKSDINNLDERSWPERNSREHRRLAEEWRDAPNETTQEQIFKKHGLRYTELLRLPYWDPTVFCVVDTMHSLLLGNLKRHCRHIWGMGAQYKSWDGLDTGAPADAPEDPDDLDLEALRQIVYLGTEDDLESLTAEQLETICGDLNIKFDTLAPSPSILDMRVAVKSYVRSRFI